jgi:hypothetical protein
MADLETHLKHWLGQLDLGDKDSVVVTIKVLAKSKRFFYGDSSRAREMIARHQSREAASNLEYCEHKAGPEWLFCLTLADGGLGIAEASLNAMRSVTDLVALAVKTHRDERRIRRKRSEPLSIVVWGFDPKGVFAESPDFTITLHGDDEPKDEQVGDIVAAAIHTIAEVRQREDEREDG